MKVIQIMKTSSSDSLSLTEIPEPSPNVNEVKIAIEYTGINFIDIYYRTGIYKSNVFPFIPGMEASGTIVEIGDEVTGLSTGDKVAYCMINGSYAEYNCVPADKVVKIPDKMDTKFGAASMLQGLTAHYLTHSTYKINPNDKVLVHAASGGVGLLLVQILKLLGATVVATTSTKEKMDNVKKFGADYVFSYDNFVEETLNSIGRLSVVYDSVGKDTFHESMDVLQPRGYLVLFGQSSGVVPNFNPGLLAQKGSLFLTRPSLNHYLLTYEELISRSNQLFDWIENKRIKIMIDSIHNLNEAGKAQERLEKRLNVGKVLLKIS